MKSTFVLAAFICCTFFIVSCKKNGTSPASPATQTACQLISESTTLSGNHATYDYTYDTKGNIIMMKKFIGDSYHVLQDSSLVSDISIARFNVYDWPYVSTLMEYDVSFDLMPAKSHLAFTENGITRVNQFTYFFFYDAKNRLYKVGEQTDNVTGDYEYDLTIYYNDDDNVTSLSYEFTTGPRTITTITASGYDDHPTPFAAIKNWPFIMHAAWNNYDPEPLFTALSKNNPLGYTMPDGSKREMTYTYNSNGFPTVRSNTNITANDTASFDETFDYACQ